MGVNAFRGYLDELRHAKSQHLDPKDIKSNQSKKSKRKRNKKSRNRNKKEEEIYEISGHQFVLSMANIPTVCEVCSSLMWLMEKIWVCKGCKLTCHKKCATKVMVTCRDNSKPDNNKVFGAELQSLTSDDCRIPLIVEQLITTIELKGLYTEGKYFLKQSKLLFNIFVHSKTVRNKWIFFLKLLFYFEIYLRIFKKLKFI
jgi:myosin-9